MDFNFEPANRDTDKLINQVIAAIVTVVAVVCIFNLWSRKLGEQRSEFANSCASKCGANKSKVVRYVDDSSQCYCRVGGQWSIQLD